MIDDLFRLSYDSRQCVCFTPAFERWDRIGQTKTPPCRIVLRQIEQGVFCALLEQARFVGLARKPMTADSETRVFPARQSERQQIPTLAKVAFDGSDRLDWKYAGIWQGQKIKA